MLPSRGLTRAHGLVFQNQVCLLSLLGAVKSPMNKSDQGAQILSRAPARSITRQITPTSRPAVANARQFGTSLRSNAKPFPRPGTVGFLSGGRIGAAGLLSSQTILLSSTRRFASTDSTDPTWANASTPSSELDADFSAFPDLDTSSLMDIPEKVGYLSNLGLDYGFGPTTLLKYVLENLHFTAGLPWWGAIVGMAIMARAALVYPALIAQQESFKSRELRQDPLYRETQAKFMQAMIQGSAQSEMLELRMQMKLLQEGAGIKTWKMFLPVVIQIPLFVGGMRLMRTMAALPVPGLDSAGVLWFTDLTVPDPLYILPLVGTAVMILGIRVGYRSSVSSPHPERSPTAFESICDICANYTYHPARAPFYERRTGPDVEVAPLGPRPYQYRRDHEHVRRSAALPRRHGPGTVCADNTLECTLGAAAV